MANFIMSLNKLLANEGSYANISGDSGGETYCGVSRNNYPQWEGWDVIDRYKQHYSFPQILEFNDQLINLVRKFYRDNYWSKFRGNMFSSQLIADELLDTSVNIGLKRACLLFQKSLNILNRNQKLFSNLHLDGIIGSKSLNALRIIIEKGEEDILYKVMNIFQGSYYLTITNYNELFEKFIRGWLSRVEFKHN